MPIVTIQMMEGRTPEQVKSLIARVTDTIAEELNAPKDRIRVLVTEIPTTHWGIAGVPASEVIANRTNN
ncbi:4-oxalocrotonate tautomerase [Paenibacillus sp. GSMTC-2017]|uniref:4-oxalocrotonate tautomerase n=1 Tax=Paenibacillus sp. GSMTC-2017 TaxID=2794350 RepID=UPI0018D90C29|nr:4-oxalocrotonate tautomerase [Paenibacillus sp. GSMTC-2017]MBH5318341.1 4-oxalocrotonate tautomerase [Paenibacillus sp. GSMTC-2017]